MFLPASCLLPPVWCILPNMKAIQVSQVGGPEVLNLVDLPIPEPKPNEAVVQIKAAGVNFIDVYYREGRYPAPLPFVPGQEAAGIVTAIGSEVTNVKRRRTRGLYRRSSAPMLSMRQCPPIVW